MAGLTGHYVPGLIYHQKSQPTPQPGPQLLLPRRDALKQLGDSAYSTAAHTGVLGLSSWGYGGRLWATLHSQLRSL